jgi:hypothetical protein
MMPLPLWLLQMNRTFFIAFLFSPTVALPALAQDIHLVPTSASSSFPACALSCTLLQQAQSACVPPEASVTNQATYVNCFCQSGYLTTLHSSPNGVCDSSCPGASDRQLLESWYNNFCSSNAATTTTTAGTQSTTNSQGTAVTGPPGWYIAI